MNDFNPTSRHHHTKDERKSTVFKIRTILNIIFMLGALAGIIIYMFHSHYIGGIVIISAMAFKFSECILRLIH